MFVNLPGMYQNIFQRSADAKPLSETHVSFYLFHSTYESSCNE